MADLFGESAALLQGANSAASNYQQNQIAQESERNKLFMGGQNNLTQMMQQVMSDQTRLKQQGMQDAAANQRQAMSGQTLLDQERIQQTGGMAKQGMEDAAKEKANTITIDEKTAKLAAKAYGIPELANYANESMPLNKWSAIQKAAADDLASRTKELKVEGVQKRFETAEERRRQNDILNYTEKLEKNSTYVKLKDQSVGMNQIPTLIKLIEDGNTVAASALGIKMAKALGEVGVMTEQDVVRYIRSGQLTQKAGDILLTWMKGKPTEATLNEVNQVSSVIKGKMTESMQGIYNTYVNRLARNYKMTPEDAAFALDVPYDPSFSTSTGTNSSGSSGGTGGSQRGDPLGIRGL